MLTEWDKLCTWLHRPVYVKNLLYIGFQLFLLLLVSDLPTSGTKPFLFYTALCFGIGAESAFMFSPDVNKEGPTFASFFLTFIMHGIIAYASFKGGYYPRIIFGYTFGKAVRISALFVVLEWGAVVLLGRRIFAEKRHPVIPTWWVLAALLVVGLVIITP